MGCLEQCGQSRNLRPKGSGFVEISASQGVAAAASPAELSKMLKFEIGFSDSRGGAISALAVSQRHLGGPCSPICTRKGSGFVEISTSQDTANHMAMKFIKFDPCERPTLHAFAQCPEPCIVILMLCLKCHLLAPNAAW